MVKNKATRGLSTEAMMLITGHRSYEAFRIYDHAKATAFRAEVDASEPERNETRIKGMAALLGVSVKEVKEKLAAKQRRLVAAAKLTAPARLTGPRNADKSQKRQGKIGGGGRRQEPRRKKARRVAGLSVS
jgi:hypothetical protein